MDFPSLWARLRAFVAPFHDPRAWSLILLCAGLVWLIDPVMVKTVMVWILQAGVFLGLAVIGSRHVFPQISLTAHVEQALRGNVASGLVVLTIGLIVSAIMIAVAIWGKV